MTPIYLDYMATTPVDPKVAVKMAEYLTMDGIFGNPASTHTHGQQALAAISNARQQVANLINTDPKAIIWTSGATESNNLALMGAARFYQHQGKHLITQKTEHRSVLDCCAQLELEGFEISYLTPQTNGLMDLNVLAEAIRPDTILMSIMHVNNEVGVIQDIAAIGQLAQTHGILFHVDGAQSLGKVEFDLQNLNVDLMSFSAHKIYGPKGIGALYVRQKPRRRLQPLIYGGNHEQGLRSGTLATHQIVGMGEACQQAKQRFKTDDDHIRTLRERLLTRIAKLPGIIMNGDLKQRIPGNLNLSIEGVEGNALLSALHDLSISTASACHAASSEPSHVLHALGVPNKLAYSTIRLSIGRFTTEEEIDFAALTICQQVQRLRGTPP